MLLLLFQAGSGCSFPAWLRDFAPPKRNALPRLLAFFSSEPEASRDGESAADLDPEHERMTSAAKPAMSEGAGGDGPS